MSEKKIQVGSLFQIYEGFMIMQEGNGKTFMILRDRKWYEFLMPNQIVLHRGIESIQRAQDIIDMFEGP